MMAGRVEPRLRRTLVRSLPKHVASHRKRTSYHPKLVTIPIPVKRAIPDGVNFRELPSVVNVGTSGFTSASLTIVAAHGRPAATRLHCRSDDTTALIATDLWLSTGVSHSARNLEVNAAHNPQRTTAQMKEDGARRRALEMLLEHLYQGTPQLQYRHATGKSSRTTCGSASTVECFKCKTPLASPRDMRLDHTRPLALLWPLDGSATALCTTCNSEKRDRPPVGVLLAQRTRAAIENHWCRIERARDPSPNLKAIKALGARLDWYFDEFLKLPDLAKTRDGKQAADLLTKALRKVLSRCPGSTAPMHSPHTSGDESGTSSVSSRQHVPMSQASHPYRVARATPYPPRPRARCTLCRTRARSSETTRSTMLADAASPSA